MRRGAGRGSRRGLCPLGELWRYKILQCQAAVTYAYRARARARLVSVAEHEEHLR